MNHDPLCWIKNPHPHWNECSCCYFIAKVREDERDSIGAVRLRTAFNEHGYRDGQRDMLAKCIAALEERWSESWCGTRYASCTDPDHACRYRRLDMAALRALSANADSDGNVSERRQEKP